MKRPPKRRRPHRVTVYDDLSQVVTELPCICRRTTDHIDFVEG